MGPYCKFCNNRCFIPTSENDRIKSDLKATCEEGKRLDMLVTIQREAKEIAEKVLSDSMSIAESSRFLAALAEELEELRQ